MNRDSAETSLEPSQPLPLIAATLTLTYLFFAPATISFSNVSEFEVGFHHILPYVLLVNAVAGYLAWTLLRAAASPRVSVAVRRGGERLAMVFVALAALGWLKGNVFVWHYGTFDGGNLVWHRFDRWGMVEAVVYAVVIAAAFVKRVPAGVVRNVCLFLLVVQGASLAVAATRTHPYSRTRYQIDRSDQTVFGSRNVIIFVLDSLQADILHDVLERNPRFNRVFDGFTRLPDAVGAFPYTHAAVNAFLTARPYDNTRPIREHFRDTFFSPTSIPHRIKELGYIVHLYPPWRAMIECDPALAANITAKPPAPEVVFSEAVRTYLIAMFRYLPHVAKKELFKDRQGVLMGAGGGWGLMEAEFTTEGDLRFMRELELTARVVPGAKYFKYFHRQGMHTPFLLSRTMKLRRQPNNRWGAMASCEGSLLMAEGLIAKLKELGVYDDTMIIVMGDHGRHLRVRVPEEFAKRPGRRRMPDRIKGSAVVGVLIKPFGARGPLRRSMAPVSLMDVPKTIASAVGLPGDFPGADMMATDIPARRPRKFYEYSWSGFRGFTADYLPRITEYTVRGFSWLDSSWRGTRRYFPKG